MYELTPAYGRTYKNAKSVREDWANGKDFQVATFGPNVGSYCSIRDFSDGQYTHDSIVWDYVLIRYGANLEKMVKIKL